MGSDYITYFPSNPGRLVEVLLKFSGLWLVIVTTGRHSMRDMKKLTTTMFLIQRFSRGLYAGVGEKKCEGLAKRMIRYISKGKRHTPREMRNETLREARVTIEQHISLR